MTPPESRGVAVVTGGASGIGRAICDRLLADDYRVVVADVSAARAHAVVEEMSERRPGCATAAVVDVRVETDIASAARIAQDAFGRLDVWCNNAAIPGARGPILETDVDDWDTTMAVVLRSVFLGIKHAGRVFRDQANGGAIVNTASVAGLVGGAGPPAYAAAKAAVVQLTRYAAVELAPLRVRVNAVCPGTILTPMIDRDGDKTLPARLKGNQPWPEHGSPTAVADAVAFLASDAARFVTGEALVVDGGMIAAGVRLTAPDPSAPSGLDLGIAKEMTR